MSLPAGTPVGAVSAQAVALLQATRRGSAQHGAAQVEKAALHIGAIAFIHRFGSSLNEYVHFHVCVVDGVFETVAGEGTTDSEVQASSPGVAFHPANGIDADTVAQVQTTLQKRILRAFVGLGVLESCDAKDMRAYAHSGFLVVAGVCIQAQDRATLERLLRYCVTRAAVLFTNHRASGGTRAPVPPCTGHAGP